MGVVAFWIALAAVLIAGGWAKTRTEAQKHETLRKLIEKGERSTRRRFALCSTPQCRPGHPGGYGHV